MPTPSDPTHLHNLKTTFQSTLQSFASSAEAFKIIHTVCSPASPIRPPVSTPPSDLKTLYVIDSSFNPPSHAHAMLAHKAVHNDRGARPCRICLLLATQNADKKPQPASFEDRLVMMCLMAQSICDSLNSPSGPGGRTGEGVQVDVDVAITKKPFFMDKAAAIDASGVYGAAQQVHCTGYDTIIRIFDPKYYPPHQGLRVLDPFLSKHRLRVCYRLGESTGATVEGGGDRAEQDKFVESISDGSREGEGMKREWRQMIELVDDAEEVRGVSSTQARRAAVEGRREDLLKLVGERVAEYVIGENLYGERRNAKKSGD